MCKFTEYVSFVKDNQWNHFDIPPSQLILSAASHLQFCEDRCGERRYDARLSASFLPFITSNSRRTLEPTSSIISVLFGAAARKWMEAVLNQRSNNGSPKGELVGSKKSFQTSTSPKGQDEADNDSPVTSPITSPPYWVQSHQRSASNISIESIPNGAITLQDNTDGEDAKNRACWAKSVYIEDYVIINGSRTGIGAFVVWNITVETLHGGTMRVSKRYSEFDSLRDKLLQTFPYSEAAMPPLPPKSVISKFRPKFLENRRIKLQYFLNCILLNPEFSGSPVLKEFLFS